MVHLIVPYDNQIKVAESVWVLQGKKMPFSPTKNGATPSPPLITRYECVGHVLNPQCELVARIE